MANLIILFIICVILVIFDFFLIKYSWKKAESLMEKLMLVSFYFIGFLVTVIWILDRLDIPTKLGYLDNLDPERMFVFAREIVCSMIGPIISGLLLLFVTRWQIGIQLKDSYENKRINNSPIFKYRFSNSEDVECIQAFVENSDSKNTHPYSLFFNIENVGLNHARHISFDVVGDDINKKTFNINGEQSILKKDSDIWFELIFNYRFYKSDLKKNKKKIIIVLHYDDLLHNRYLQVVGLELNVTSIFGDNGYEFEVGEPEILDEIVDCS